MMSDTVGAGGALENLPRAFRPRACLPENVFARPWTRYLVFDPGWLFGSAEDGSSARLLLEGSDGGVCMLNLDEWESGVSLEESTFRIDASTTPDAYRAKLIGTEPSSAWMYGMERFGFVPESDDWCIYTERAGDLGVLAVRDGFALERLAPAIRKLEACEIRAAIAGASPWAKWALLDPRIPPTWRSELIRNYGDSGGRGGSEPRS